MIPVLFLLSAFAPTPGAAAAWPSTTLVIDPTNQMTIDDGWYSAIVTVTSGFSRNKYRLNVKVQYGSVVAIDFGNGGSVHTGYNNEGYIYSGGYVSVSGDEATATVSISDRQGLRYFNVSLE
jgi:hypothetical protein